MLFDFRSTYATYSNKDLLRIVAHAHQYQPEAVAAAEEILSNRTITDEDRLVDDAEVAELPKKNRKADKPKVWAEGDDIFAEEEPLENLKAAKRWKFIIAGAIGFFASYTLYGDIKWLFFYGFSDISIVHLFVLALEIAGLSMFITDRKMGWSLLMAFTSYMAVSYLFSLGFDLMYLSVHGIFSSFTKLVLFAGITGGLWLPYLRLRYGISVTEGKKTAFVALSVSLIYIVGNILVNYIKSSRSIF